MKHYDSRARILMALAVGSLAFAACSGGGGQTGMDVLATDSVVTGDGSHSGDTATDVAPARPDCASLAALRCALVQRCDSDQFIAAYDSMTNCLAVITASCTAARAVPDVHGEIDPMACLTAQGVSCDAYFQAQLESPMACRFIPGNRTMNAMCGENSQCGTGTDSAGQPVQLYCYGMTTLACNDGMCGTPDRNMSGSNLCRPVGTGRDDCDVNNGSHCVATFDATTGTNSMQTCQPIMYGVAGASCFANTNMQCASGFVCDATSKQCLSVIGEGMPCEGTTDMGRCDPRTNLQCMINPMMRTQHICRRATIHVAIGAECGTVAGVMQDCSNYAYCNMLVTPTTCTMGKALGETCIARPNNCLPGLVCTAGTCQMPMPAMCP